MAVCLYASPPKTIATLVLKTDYSEVSLSRCRKIWD